MRTNLTQLCTATPISSFAQCSDFMLAVAFVSRHVYFNRSLANTLTHTLTHTNIFTYTYICVYNIYMYTYIYKYMYIYINNIYIYNIYKLQIICQLQVT